MEPTTSATARRPTSTSRESEGASAAPRRKPVVLFVDDDSDAQHIYGTILRHEGYATVLAGDGREAVRLAVEALPDLIIMDIELPLMSGWEALEKLRGLESTRAIPVLVMSVRSRMDAPRAALLEDYLEKPVSPAQLVGAVRRLLEER